MPHTPLLRYHTPDYVEAGIDEAGRGPLFGRVYAAVVILPPDDSFPHDLMKDSKRFTSRTKLQGVAAVIRAYATEWAVTFCEAKEIDEVNILRATHNAMHKGIDELSLVPDHLLVDGDRFRPYWNIRQPEHEVIPHICVCKGDNTYTSIAAAGILAKVARDDWIDELCAADPTLDERYGLLSNKGYGTAQHMEGLRRYGPTPQHRMTFGPCSLATTPQPPDAADSTSKTESDADSEMEEQQEEKEVDDGGAAVTPI
jgi:ribonuclease HII